MAKVMTELWDGEGRDVSPPFSTPVWMWGISASWGCSQVWQSPFHPLQPLQKVLSIQKHFPGEVRL